MTPEELRKKAAELDKKAEAALERGDRKSWQTFIRQSWAASDLAEERERMEQERKARGKARLPVGNNPRIMSGKNVTTAQLKRRGAAVARGWAARTGSQISAAITASDYKSLTRYAKERLKISQPALSRYISGSLPCPRFVADAVQADFELDHSVWPKGVVD